MTKRSAFTLAEIIITLTIIGVVAAMTIPDMVQDIHDMQYRIAWKKAYADLDQATRMALADNGGSFKNKCGWDWDSNCFRNLYLPYLRYIKSCNEGQSFGVCWHNDGGWKNLKGESIGTGWGNIAGLVLADGKMIRFAHISNSCTDQSDTSASLPQCGYFMVDINGFSGPNRYGKDIYLVHLFENRIMPYGMQGDKYLPAIYCTKTSDGRGCAALYLYQ